MPEKSTGSRVERFLKFAGLYAVIVGVGRKKQQHTGRVAILAVEIS